MSEKRFFEVARVYLFLLFLPVALSACGGGGTSEVSGSPALPPPAGPGEAVVAWDPVTQNSDGTPCLDLAGYRVYFGDTPGVTKNNPTTAVVPLSSLPDRNNPSVVIGSLTSGKKYYFRVTAFDTSNNESSLSDAEAEKIIL